MPCIERHIDEHPQIGRNFWKRWSCAVGQCGKWCPIADTVCLRRFDVVNLPPFDTTFKRSRGGMQHNYREHTSQKEECERSKQKCRSAALGCKLITEKIASMRKHCSHNAEQISRFVQVIFPAHPIDDTSVEGVKNCPFFSVKDLEAEVLPIQNMRAPGLNGIPVEVCKLVFCY